MSFLPQIKSLTQFLQTYQDFWSTELLRRIPENWDQLPWELSSPLDSVDLEQLYRPPQIPKNSELYELIQMRNKLISLPQLPTEAIHVEKNDWLGVTGKKQHEIGHLLAFLNQYPSFIDLAGGKAILGRTACHVLGKKVLSIDFDQNLQTMGAQEYQKRIREQSGELEFIKADLFDDTLELDHYFSSYPLSLGLHTCGGLSLRHLNFIKKYPQKNWINIPCCYQHLNLEKEIHLSSYSQEHPLPLNRDALTLATRRPIEGEKSFRFGLKVKKYRFFMHLLLQEEYGAQSFGALGNSSASLYRGSFAEYAQVQLAKNKLNHFKSAQAFYECPQRQIKAQKYLRLNWVRNLFARVIEVYLLVDRCLALEEEGITVELKQIFNSEISPRNLMMYSLRESRF